MKKFTKILALVIIAVVFLTAAGCQSKTAEKKKLIMGTSASFPPYEYVDGDKIVGIDAEIAAAVCAKMGYELEIQDMEFGALISAVSTGKIDFAMAGMTVTEERLQSVNFCTPYAKGVQTVIVAENSPITTVDDLFLAGKNYVIGVQESTTGDIYATGDLEEKGLATINRYPNGNEAVLALTTGKIDCVIIDNNPAKAYVAANPGLKLLDTAYAEEDYAAAFNKNATELLDKFNAALAELTADGTIDAIIEKYIPTK